MNSLSWASMPSPELTLSLTSASILLFRASTLPVRLVGMLGRMLEPIGLLEDVRQMFMEYLTKNAKKLVSIAEEFDCPEIIKTAYKYGVINSKNEKTIRKRLIESKLPEISALADFRANDEYF